MDSRKLDKRSNSACSSLSSFTGSSSSLEKRPRLARRQQHPGVCLKQARAAFANHSFNKDLWTTRSGSISHRRFPRRHHSSESFKLSRRKTGLQAILPSVPLEISSPKKTALPRRAPRDITKQSSQEEGTAKQEEVLIPNIPLESARSPRLARREADEVPREIFKKAPLEEYDVPALGAEEDEDSKIIPRLLLEELEEENHKTVARALERLGRIFKRDPTPAKCHQAVRLGGPRLLLAALKKWPKSHHVARHGCHAIFRMIGTYTKNPPPHAEDEQNIAELFLGLDTASVLHNVMVCFPRDCEVQLFGMGALGELFQNHTGISRKAALKLVIDGGILSVLVQAMYHFSRHAKLQEFGCWLSARLCYCLGRAQSQAVFKEETLVAVATAVQNHPHNASIDKQAGIFMATLFGIPRRDRDETRKKLTEYQCQSLD